MFLQNTPIYKSAGHNIPEDCILKANDTGLNMQLFMSIWYQLTIWIVTAVSDQWICVSLTFNTYVQGKTVHYLFFVNSPPAKASPAPFVSTTFSGGNWMAGNSFTIPSEMNIEEYSTNSTLQQLHILHYSCHMVFFAGKSQVIASKYRTKQCCWSKHQRSVWNN